MRNSSYYRLNFELSKEEQYLLAELKTLINIHKEKHKGNHDRSSSFVFDKALVSS